MKYLKLRKKNLLKNLILNKDLLFKIEGNCWIWIRSTTQEGYPHAKIDGKLQLVYRALWESLYGEIPKGYQIDHTCNKERCIAPIHLERVTPTENVLRSYRRGRVSYWKGRTDWGNRRFGGS
jgi:hypothetical protein